MVPWSWRLYPFSDRRLRQGTSSKNVLEKHDSNPAIVAVQQVKASKFQFRKGLGSIRQAWQRLRVRVQFWHSSQPTRDQGWIVTNPERSLEMG